MKTIYQSIRFSLAILILSILNACNREESEPTINTALLSGKQWQLSHIEELAFPNSTASQPMTIRLLELPLCQQGDAIEFQSDQGFIRYNLLNQCANEQATQTSLWTVNQPMKILSFEDTDYQVITLTSTKLELQTEVALPNSPLIVINKYYYNIK